MPDTLSNSGAPSSSRSFRFCERKLARVHAADEDIEHEVDALDVVETIALLFGLDQLRDQVVRRVLAARVHERLRVVVELRARLLDLLALRRHADHVELALDPV